MWKYHCLSCLWPSFYRERRPLIWNIVQRLLYYSMWFSPSYYCYRNSKNPYLRWCYIPQSCIPCLFWSEWCPWEQSPPYAPLQQQRPLIKSYEYILQEKSNTAAMTKYVLTSQTYTMCPLKAYSNILAHTTTCIITASISTFYSTCPDKLIHTKKISGSYTATMDTANIKKHKHIMWVIILFNRRKK